MTSRFKAARKWLPEIFVFVIVLGAIHLYRTNDMLDAGGQPAPPLTLESLAGHRDGLKFVRERPALVYFFAPWCRICAASSHNIRNLRRLRDDDDLAIFLVALDWQSAEEVRQYVERHDLQVPVLLGSRQTGTDWGVSVFPTYYMLDRDHRVVHRDYGYSTLAGLWGRSLFL